MLDRRYEHHFLAVQKGRTTFEEFVRATMPLWRRQAAEIHRRWPVPKWHTQEETIQNLLLAAWMFIWEYEPEKARGRSLQRYVVWNAFDKAKKAVHVARAARRSGNADIEPSHFEKSLSVFDADREASTDQHDDSYADRSMYILGAYTAPDQESTLIEREDRAERGARAWAWADSFEEMRALEVLADSENVHEAASRMWQDAEVRLELNLAGPEDAERVVRRVTKAVAKRMSAAA